MGLYPEVFSTSHLFTAASPAEAVRAAVRLARAEERTARPGCDLVGMFLRTLRVREVGMDGSLGEWRTRAFAAWRATSGHTLERLLDKIHGDVQDPVG